MKQNKKNTNYLSSTVPLKASLKTSISSAKATMGFYPLANLFQDGKHPKYLIKTEDPEIFYMITLKSDSVIFTSYSTISPFYMLKESILRVVSICSLLSNDYLIHANSLFPYLINLLSKNEIIKPEKKYNYNRDSDILLSKRIVTLLAANKNLSVQLAALNKDLIKVTSEFILNEYNSDSNLIKIESETGINQLLLSEALRQIQANGNKVIYNGKGNFNIVRA